MFNKKKFILATSLMALATSANAGYTLKISDTDSLSFGGYIKIDARYADGDVAYRDFWIGTAGTTEEDKSQFRLNANQTRFNSKYIHGDVTGFLELDFYGGGGSQTVSNSSNPRLRHAFIKYKDVLVGQTWSTFMNTSALGETADFAGATVGIVFVRQGQIRYTSGNFQFSLENPESVGGDSSNDSVPDMIARYNFKGDWGNVSVSGLARSLTDSIGHSENAFGISVAGKIKTVGKDDLKFQIHQGKLGRYVGIAFAKDFVGDEVEETTAYLVNYRHFWSENLRSTLQYGHAESDVANKKNSQWSVNLFTNFTKELAVGVEVGNFSMDQVDADSNYAQLSFKYTL
ncbi:MAG: hypothetical protein ACJAT7_003550 [Psychromonas sp.]|jgi:hypothetical protein|uniref:DcaP family trimeric outer membrane transporter n=1 Tax=Psychromonas sp. TaxID=1884585 RepID=UPI0039E2EC1E